MIGLSCLEVNNSVFSIMEENCKFKLYSDFFDEIPFTELKDELEVIVGLAHIQSSEI